MSTKALTAGGRIETRCSRCDDVTGHVIVAMVDGEVVKVECRACGSVHKYRPAKPVKAKAQAPAVRHVRAGASRSEAVAVKPARAHDLAAKQTAAKSASESPVNVDQSRSEAARKAAVTRAATRAAQEAQATEVAWKVAISRQTESCGTPYDMNATFTVGEIVEHIKFGLGEVRSVTKPNKMEVLFQDGLRILRCVC
ncbi:MAG: hypothetical protein R3Y11_09475 [Pseudomonadota bacterium]